MADLIVGLVSAVFEAFFEGTGRCLLSLFGLRHPHHLTSFFTGMTFWIFVGLLAYTAFHR
ncbi:hypothetical protein [Bradyrhizobium murdochi]|uniref:hypothetical protein n=1 Tax=Bradyrhizobium murdochi TaxID=1038859 RepID=UPI0004072CBE|nr:hypothetical protein [Bradyrhizobium murdochi]